MTVAGYHSVETNVDADEAVKVEIGYNDAWDCLRISLDGFDKAGWESVAASAWLDREEAHTLGTFLLDWALAKYGDE